MPRGDDTEELDLMGDWLVWVAVAVGLFLAFVVAWFVVVEVNSRRRQPETESTDDRDIDLDPLP